MRSRVSLRRSREPLSHFKGYSRSDTSDKARVFFGVVCILAGTYACLSPALAEFEEGAGQDAGRPSSITTLSGNTVTNPLIDNSADDDVGEYFSTPDKSRDDIDFRHLSAETYTGGRPAFQSLKNSNGFDDVLIPDTVWSLDVSTGAHLNHIPAGPDSEPYTTPGGLLGIDDFWIRAIFGSWSAIDAYNARYLLVPPPQLQVASCGGSSAESSSLDYCSVNLVGNQPSNQSQKKSDHGGSETETQGAGNNVLSSSDSPASYSSAQPNIAPFPSAIADIKSLLQGTLIVLGSCDDASVSCATTQIAPPETPLDSPASSDDGLTTQTDPPYPEAPTPGPVISVDDPGSGPSLPPVITPEPLKPIPEPSTWVMTVIGFSVMALIFGKKRRPRINIIQL